MALYEMVDSKTGNVVEEAQSFRSGGDAKKYAATLGKTIYAKRVYAATGNE